jgi:hypothetical protein
VQIYNVFDKLRDSGELDILVKNGIIPSSIKQYYDIHQLYAKKKARVRKITRFTEATLKEQISIESGACRTKVYKAIAYMSQSAI